VANSSKSERRKKREQQPEGEVEDSTENRADPELVAQLGALLFVSTRPLDVETLADLTQSSSEDVEAALADLSKKLDEQALGFGLFEVGGSWQLRTGPQNATVVQRLIPPRARRLSRAAAETLAVVAYKQPVQRSEIEAIRGVDALPTLRTLLDARLIRIVGREASPGQPALYGTTTTFLEKFGLNDLADLPAVRELVELAEEPGEAEIEDGEPTEVSFDETDTEYGRFDAEAQNE